MTPAISHALLEVLKEKRMSYREMEEASDLQRHVVRRWLTSVRADKLVHVAGWGEDERGRLMVPLFAYGNQEDAVRPTPKTAAERMRESRERRRVQ